MAFVRSERYGAASRGHLIVGSLRGNRLHRLVWDGQRLVRRTDAAASDAYTAARDRDGSQRG